MKRKQINNIICTLLISIILLSSMAIAKINHIETGNSLKKVGNKLTEENHTFYSISDLDTLNAYPIANFTYYPENPTTEDVIYFNDTSTDPDGFIVSWLWDFDDGDTNDSQNTTHQYNDAGIYKVTLNVTDDGGATDEISKEINVTETNDPPFAPVIDGDTEGEVNEELSFTISTIDPEEDEVKYYIDWGDGSYEDWFGPYASGDQVTKKHSWEEAGIYNVTGKAKDIHDNESDWGNKHTVIINETPSVPVILKIKLKVISIGKVKATIENQGEGNVSNINWSMTVKVLRILRRTVDDVNGNITSLTSGGKVDISTEKKVRFRFGIAKVKIIAEIDGQEVAKLVQRVLIIGRIVLARPKLLGI
jgi:hypothetical protein